MNIRLFLCLCLLHTACYAQQALQPGKGLNAFFAKLESGKPVVVAYLGGSITAAPGYRVQTEKWLRSAYPASTIKTINAGVGGTGSSLGAFRLDADVLPHQPDLVFVEFAVNDNGGDSLTICRAMEGIVRKIKTHDPQTDICFLYTINEPMVAGFQKGVLPASMRYMQVIADYYGLPSINLGWDVLRLVEAGKLAFRGEQQGRIAFTRDGTHPTDEGHQCYTATIKTALTQLKQSNRAQADRLPSARYPGNLQYAKVISPADKAVKLTGHWKPLKEMPALKGFLTAYPDAVYTGDPNDSLTIHFKGSYFGIGDILGPTVCARVIISVDGKIMTQNRFDRHCSWNRRNYFFIDELPDTEHTLTVKIDPEKIDKLKMLNKGEDPGDTSRYAAYNFYIGNIMLPGGQ
ncbi:SGNH/GDSL hydrolase family protein [Chitinophaga cymbidii]|uniref:Acyl-CoA thioesterase n=1 Tax=Chitinophaga cymbidii TaxID=1096750 RepID=A0A512RR83_9BACT|nr:SGNH/GDSL hydrolase family protein [Chitinophaga cymbidii]GEP98192.1 acyl-CoA thioesterase [Chitinophaga cymbidii]